MTLDAWQFQDPEKVAIRKQEEALRIAEDWNEKRIDRQFLERATQ